MIVLTATNVDELEQQWDALIDLRSTNLLASTGPFVSKHLTTSLSDVCIHLSIVLSDEFTSIDA